MVVNVDKLKKLIEVFYQPPFKIFYVNSTDAKTFIKPIGVFVSLGITTSPKVLSNIKNIIDSDPNFNAIVANITSKKVNDQYLNTLIGENEQQYRIENLPPNVLDKTQAEEELDRLHEKMSVKENLEVLQKYAPKVSQLQDLISDINSRDDWENQLIQKDDEENYRIFHRLVNYQKLEDTEFRLGIFVRGIE